VYCLSAPIISKIENIQKTSKEGEWNNVVTHMSRTSSPCRITLVRGDITRFAEADAIVNPGNETLLGCFTPGHTCLDNQIHARAGPELHRVCAAIMQSRTAQPGECILTEGFCLPARHVIHAYGPNVHLLGEVRPDLLMQTYQNCLTIAAQHNLRSVAFPTISTGLYGYPKQDAAAVAFRAVVQWMKRATPDTSLRQVFFVVFDEEDDRAYKECIRSAAM